MDTEAECKLCKKTEKLRNSHVISEFFYKPLYDSKHRMNMLSTEASRTHPMLQKGLREYLLCGDCEVKLSVFEGHAKKVIFESTPKPTAYPELLVHTGVDYKAFKLFILSLFWRMSIAKIEFFQHVQLLEHEEILREAILNKQPLLPSQYPFFVSPMYWKGKFLHDITTQPTPITDDANDGYRVLIAGYHFTFVLNPRRFPSPFLALTLNENGKLVLMNQDVESAPYILDCFEKQGQAIRERKAKGKPKI